MSAEAIALLGSSVVKGLADKSYDRRKTAAVELEKKIKSLISSDNATKIKQIINQIKVDYLDKAILGLRKGGLIAIASIAIAVEYDINQFIDYLIPPIFQCISDQEDRVRFYACESLYNIAKVAKYSILPYFTEIFDALTKLVCDTDNDVRNGAQYLDRLVKDIVCESEFFDINSFVTLLHHRLSNHNVHIRIFILSWISILHSVPSIPFLKYIPLLATDLFLLALDSNKECSQVSESILSEFLIDIRTAPLEEVSDVIGELGEPLYRCCQSSDVVIRQNAIAWVIEICLLLSSSKILIGIPKYIMAILSCMDDIDESVAKIAVNAHSILLTSVTQILRLQDMNLRSSRRQRRNSVKEFNDYYSLDEHQILNFPLPTKSSGNVRAGASSSLVQSSSTAIPHLTANSHSVSGVTGNSLGGKKVDVKSKFNMNYQDPVQHGTLSKFLSRKEISSSSRNIDLSSGKNETTVQAGKPLSHRRCQTDRLLLNSSSLSLKNQSSPVHRPLIAPTDFPVEETIALLYKFMNPETGDGGERKEGEKRGGRKNFLDGKLHLPLSQLAQWELLLEQHCDEVESTPNEDTLLSTVTVPEAEIEPEETGAGDGKGSEQPPIIKNLRQKTSRNLETVQEKETPTVPRREVFTPEVKISSQRPKSSGSIIHYVTDYFLDENSGRNAATSAAITEQKHISAQSADIENRDATGLWDNAFLRHGLGKSSSPSLGDKQQGVHTSIATLQWIYVILLYCEKAHVFSAKLIPAVLSGYRYCSNEVIPSALQVITRFSCTNDAHLLQSLHFAIGLIAGHAQTHAGHSHQGHLSQRQNGGGQGGGNRGYGGGLVHKGEKGQMGGGGSDSSGLSRGKGILKHLASFIATEKLFYAICLILDSNKDIYVVQQVVDYIIKALFSSKKYSVPVLETILMTCMVSPAISIIILAWIKEYDLVINILNCIAFMEPSMGMIMQLELFLQVFDSPIFSRVRMDLLHHVHGKKVIHLMQMVAMLLPSSNIESINARLKIASLQQGGMTESKTETTLKGLTEEFKINLLKKLDTTIYQSLNV